MRNLDSPYRNDDVIPPTYLKEGMQVRTPDWRQSGTVGRVDENGYTIIWQEIDGRKLPDPLSFDYGFDVHIELIPNN